MVFTIFHMHSLQTQRAASILNDWFCGPGWPVMPVMMSSLPLGYSSELAVAAAVYVGL